MLTTGVEPAVRAEAENSLAHTLELRFLKMFEFEDEEGVFYDVLVNSEKLRNSYFINFCFVQGTGLEAFRKVRSICCSQTGASSQALPALCRQKCTDEVRNEPFFYRLDYFSYVRWWTNFLMFNCILEINKTGATAATTAFLSPLYQSLLSVTEKKIAKKCLKE